jgi:hypothetical protein
MTGSGTAISIDCDHPIVAEIADNPVSGQTFASMASQPSASQPMRLPSFSPQFFFACAVVLIAAGVLFHRLEQDPKVPVPTAADEAAAAEAAAARRMQRLREREAQARIEVERKEAEERTRRALLVDGPTEAAAKKAREESALRQTKAVEEQRAATRAEEAWQRFYKPSAECRDPAAATRMECVNEYVKAKRAFQASQMAGPN